MPPRSSLYLFILLTLVFPYSAHAQPIYLWGLGRDCEQFTSANRQAEKQLNSAAQSVALLHTPAGKPLPPCQGERCAQILRRSCPAASGRVLGGQVVQGRDTWRFRLWLYDLATDRIAFQDDYTQNPDISNAFILQAKTLLQNPRFGSAPSQTPLYCSRPAQASAESSPPGSPVFLTVYGDSKHNASLHGALEQQLQLLGKTPLPLPFETRSYSLDVLQRIVSEKQNARVLGAEVKKDGSVRMFLFDQNTNLTSDTSLSCNGCDRDKLILQVKEAVAELLDHCFTTLCAQNGKQPPVEACEPFPEAKCGGLDAPSKPGPTGVDQDLLTPRTAHLLTGLSWGTFAAVAVTGAVLAGISGTSAGDYTDQNGVPIKNHLSAPGYAVLGIAGGLLVGIAIPTTVLVKRAGSRTSQPEPNQQAGALLQCPN